MLPVVSGAKSTRHHVLAYTAILVACSLLPTILGYSGMTYGVCAAALGAGFLIMAARVSLDQQDAAGVSLTNDKPARQAFKYSLVYLFALFSAVAIDHWLR